MRRPFYNQMKGKAEILILGLCDLLSLYVVFELAVLIRTDLLPVFYPHFPAEYPFRNMANLAWVLAVWLFFFYYENLYTRRFSLWDEIEALVKVSLFSTISVFTIISIGKLSIDISRTLVVLMGLLAAIFLPLLRVLAKKGLRSLGFLKRRVLILGATESGRLIAHALRKESNYGYVVVGFLDDSPERVGSEIDGIRVRKGIYRAGSYIRRSNITDLVIALESDEKEKIHAVISRLQHRVERLLFVPDIFGLIVLETSLVHFFQEQVFAFEIRNNLLRPVNRVIKRLFDIVVSLFLGVLVALPVCLLSFLIRLQSAGPAIFVQKRIGRKGKEFECYKLRSMYADAEQRLQTLLKMDDGAREEWEKHWKLKKDPRVTPLGRILRRFSLDELPQLINVIKGEMSLIGPRPYLNRERRLMGEHYQTILRTRPGITGLWQVSGRSSMDYTYRVSLDAWYVKNWSLWLDLMILVKTVYAVVKREGAY